MSNIERKARELLAEAYRKSEYPPMVRDSHNMIHGYLERRERAAISAIVAALTPPDAFVLVPLRPSVDMRGAFKGTFPCDTHKAIHFSDFDVRYTAMLGARPEVK